SVLQFVFAGRSLLHAFDAVVRKARPSTFARHHVLGLELRPCAEAVHAHRHVDGVLGVVVNDHASLRDRARLVAVGVVLHLPFFHLSCEGHHRFSSVIFLVWTNARWPAQDASARRAATMAHGAEMPLRLHGFPSELVERRARTRSRWPRRVYNALAYVV